MTRRLLAPLAGLLLAAATPAPAAADLLLTPFAGVSFTEDVRKGNFGVALGVGSLIGLEGEISQTRLGTFDDVPLLRLSAKATTYMANLVVRLPAGPVQPYATAGVGLIQLSGDVEVALLGSLVSAKARDLGTNVGGGLYLFPSPNFGLRADMRYFRTIGDLTLDRLGDIDGLDDLPLPNLDFWRVTGGITFRF